MTKAPERIWLQYVEPHCDDNTWCEDQINDDDVEYIRADIARAEREALEAQNRDLLEWADRLSEALGVQIAQNGSRNAAALNKDFRGFRAAIAKAKGEA